MRHHDRERFDLNGIYILANRVDHLATGSIFGWIKLSSNAGGRIPPVLIAGGVETLITEGIVDITWTV